MTRLVAIFCYYLCVDFLFYCLNRRAKRIITFHNVLPHELWEANLANGVSNSLDDFKFIVREVGRRFTFSNDVLDEKTVTITFDDGYHNQYEYAFKTLRAMNIPALIFISGDIKTIEQSTSVNHQLSILPSVTSSSTALVIDKLLHWVCHAPIELIPDGERRKYWVNVVWPRFMNDGAMRGQTLMKEFESKYSYDKIDAQLSAAYKKERLSGISNAEKEDMRKAGWLIGWHTKSHSPLSRLSATDLRNELDSPAEYRNVCLSYPYGNPVEVGNSAIKLAEELGYPCAVSNCIDADRNDSRYFLPRMSLSADKFLLHFELSGCKHFLKHITLLKTVEST